jgi:hypothetical protein
MTLNELLEPIKGTYFVLTLAEAKMPEKDKLAVIKDIYIAKAIVDGDILFLHVMAPYDVINFYKKPCTSVSFILKTAFINSTAEEYGETWDYNDVLELSPTYITSNVGGTQWGCLNFLMKYKLRKDNPDE